MHYGEIEEMTYRHDKYYLKEVLASCRWPHENVVKLLKLEVDFLKDLAVSGFALRTHGDFRRLAICEREIKRLERDVLPFCGLKYLIPKLISEAPLDMPGAREHLAKLGLLDYPYEYVHPERVLRFLKEYFAAECAPYSPIYPGSFREVVLTLRHFLRPVCLELDLERYRDGLPERGDADFKECMGILQKRFRVLKLMRERCAKIIQRATRRWLSRLAAAATVIQRRYLEYRFRPGATLARRTVKRLHDLATSRESKDVETHEI